MLQLWDKSLECSDPFTLFLPGWATGYEVFTDPHLGILTKNFLPQALHAFHAVFVPHLTVDTLSELVTWVTLQPVEVKLVGFSMGALLAAQLAILVPSRITELALVSVRPFYPKPELDSVADNLKKAFMPTLQGFYKAGLASSILWTEHKALFQGWMDRFEAEELIALLEVLAALKLPDNLFDRILNVSFFQGENDLIAPLFELQAWMPQSKQSHLTVLPGGHFLG